jgi:hypothetical protein
MGKSVSALAHRDVLGSSRRVHHERRFLPLRVDSTLGPDAISPVGRKDRSLTVTDSLTRRGSEGALLSRDREGAGPNDFLLQTRALGSRL